MRLIILTISVLCIIGLASASACAEDVLEIRVAGIDKIQQIDGFGASGAWWAQMVGGWSDERIDTILELLYGREGAWLSIYRHNIGAGGGDEIVNRWRRTESHDASPREYDWSKDANATLILRRVVRLGVKNIVFFANSPPPWLTRSGLVSGGLQGEDNYKHDSEREVATRLVDIAEYWRNALGLDVAYLSPLNEPRWDWGKDDGHRSQEGAHLSPHHVATITHAVVDEVRRRRAPLKIEALEAGEWAGGSFEDNMRAIDSMLKRRATRESIHALSVHSYWPSLESRVSLREYLDHEWPGIRLAATEYCNLEWGRGLGIKPALDMAGIMMMDLGVGEASSWSFWTAVSGHDYQDGLIYIYEEPMPIEGWGENKEPDRIIIESKRLWVMAHFSRFIRPGDFRIKTTLEPAGSDSVTGLGFWGEENGLRRLVFVVMNTSSDPVRLEFDVPQEFVFDAEIEHRVTDATKNFERAAHDSEALVAPSMSLNTITFVSRREIMVEPD